MAEPKNLAETVIAAFGGVSKTARACGHKSVTTVDGWKRAGRIPHWRRPELIDAAAREGVTLPTEFLDASTQDEAAA